MYSFQKTRFLSVGNAVKNLIRTRGERLRNIQPLKSQFITVANGREIYICQKSDSYLPIYLHGLQKPIWGYIDLPINIIRLQEPIQGYIKLRKNPIQDNTNVQDTQRSIKVWPSKTSLPFERVIGSDKL